MKSRLPIVVAAIMIWWSPAVVAQISSKKTLYCELTTPRGSSSCLFPVPVTKWPPWVPEALKDNILDLEEASELVGSLISGINNVNSAISGLKTVGSLIGAYEPAPSELDLILDIVQEINMKLDELKALQRITYDGLSEQLTSFYLGEAAADASAANTKFKEYYNFRPDYGTCLATYVTNGDPRCFPYFQEHSTNAGAAAMAALDSIERALNLLDGLLNGRLIPVWLDNGDPPGFDPRAAGNMYFGWVAQEAQILSWAVSPSRIPLTLTFPDRLYRRAKFINQQLIPKLRDWVHTRCLNGPHSTLREAPADRPQQFGLRWEDGSYYSQYPDVGERTPIPGTEIVRDGYWTKSCDYSQTTTHVYYCSTYPDCTVSKLPPMNATNPYYKGDDTELATLERIGLSNWSNQAANLIALANGVSYAGCYSRQGTNALLPNHPRALSVSDCIKAARANGDTYAQQTPAGCYTGNGIGQLIPIRDASCNQECTFSVNGEEEKSGEMCGGQPDGSSIYLVANSPGPHVSSNVVGGKTSYVGCYQSLILTTQTVSAATAAECLRAAVSARVVYASIRPNGECKLSNSLLWSVPLPESSCSSPCPGDGDQRCGGPGDQRFGGPGAESVFATYDPLPLTCSSTRADCNGNLADFCETDITTVANCGACGNVCGAGQYCALDQTCKSALIANAAFSLSQAISFTGTSSVTGSQGSYIRVNGATAGFTLTAGEKVTLNIDLFAYVPSGSSNMSIDLRFLIDGSVVGSGRFSTSRISFTSTVTLPSTLLSGAHTVTVEARSVLNSGPPVTLQLYGNSGGAANSCFTYECGPKPANLTVSLVP